ncbi:MAG: 30S ribosomal protein S20 [Thermodesulfobacteriota bacterium]|nr:30S ribosomal protein S20 [Thermodesulfobacteriota bacterium]
MAADQNNFDLTVQRLDEAKSMLAKAAKKGVIHRNAASRKISRLSKLVNTLRA